MKASSNAHLRRTLLCALFAGSIAAPFAAPHAYALPIEGANAPTNAGEANISTSGTTMDITGKTEHNVLRWEDCSEVNTGALYLSTANVDAVASAAGTSWGG